MPVHTYLMIVTIAPPALPVLLATPSIIHTRFACQTHWCQANKVHSFLIELAMEVTAIDDVVLRALRFQSCSVLQIRKSVPFPACGLKAMGAKFWFRQSKNAAKT